jgi:DNA-directed RNA polymerase subunit RPC12/RpoP
MIRFSCPTCGKHLKAPDHGVGRKTSCPRCGQRLLISPPVPAQDKAVLGEPVPGSASPSPGAGTVTATCPGCGRAIPFKPHELYQTFECAQCSTRFVPAESPEADESLTAGLGRPVSNPHAVADVLPVEAPADVLPAEGPAPGRRTAKRQGFPLWVLAAITPVGVLLLCCGGIGLITVANRSADGISNATSDFDQLGRWCERCGREVKAASAANPIRGKELRQKHLEQFRTRVLGKEVRWRFKVVSVDERGVTVRCKYTYTYVPDPMVDHFGIVRTFDPIEVAVLTVQLPGHPGAGGPGAPVGSGFFGNLPRQRLRDISVGDRVMVVGTVEGANSDGEFDGAALYSVLLKDARIE